jgi:membrane-bound acyltransferase YfiQ involved in biofilm formation
MLYAPYGAVTEQKFATMARKFINNRFLGNFLGNFWKFLFQPQVA